MLRTHPLPQVVLTVLGEILKQPDVQVIVMAVDEFGRLCFGESRVIEKDVDLRMLLPDQHDQLFSSDRIIMVAINVCGGHHVVFPDRSDINSATILMSLVRQLARPDAAEEWTTPRRLMCPNWSGTSGCRRNHS